MNARTSIYRLLQLALLEIRHEACDGGDIRNIAALSDLFHNIPNALAAEDADFDKLLADLTKRASANIGLSRWLENNAEQRD